MITTLHLLGLSLIIFTIALAGILLIHRTFITIMIGIELMLLAANINFIVLARSLNMQLGYAVMLFILSIAAIEMVIGLAIMVVYYYKYNNINFQNN